MFNQLKKVLNEETNLKKGRPPNQIDSLIPSIQITSSNNIGNHSNTSLNHNMLMFQPPLPQDTIKPIPQNPVSASSSSSLINQQRTPPPPQQQQQHILLMASQSNMNKPQSPFHPPQHLMPSPHHLAPNSQNCNLFYENFYLLDTSLNCL